MGYSGCVVPAVNLTYVVLAAVCICILSMIIDELHYGPFFHHASSNGHGASNTHSLLHQHAGAHSTIAHALFGEATSISSQEAHTIVQGFVAFSFFVVLSIWGVTAYLKLKFLRASNNGANFERFASSRLACPTPQWMMNGNTSLLAGKERTR